MTPEEVLLRVNRIRDMAGDHEAAHSEEDALHRDVLAAIASGAAKPWPQECARIALTTAEIEFARWCA